MFDIRANGVVQLFDAMRIVVYLKEILLEVTWHLVSEFGFLNCLILHDDEFLETILDLSNIDQIFLLRSMDLVLQREEAIFLEIHFLLHINLIILIAHCEVTGLLNLWGFQIQLTILNIYFRICTLSSRQSSS